MDDTKFKVIDGGKIEEPAGDYISDVFGEKGYLSKQIDGYQPRPGQIRLARAIDHGIREGRHIIAEGPTGIGKSFAYSVPAAYHAVHTGRRFCIVTANKTLQAQIVNKDLADLATAVPQWNFSYAVRKGISSYLCVRNLRDGKWRDLLFSGELTGADEDMIEKVRAWSDETTTGDFEESPGPSKKIWSAFSTYRDECDGKRCRDISTCHVAAAKDRSAGADIIVTNYHLFYLHLNHIAAGRPGWILPPFEVAILDEAHNAANIARDFFGGELAFASIYRCVTNLHMIEVRGFKKKGERLRKDVLDAARTLWGTLAYRARNKQHVLTAPDDCRSVDLEAQLTAAADLYMKVAAALQPAKPSLGGTVDAMTAKNMVDAENYRRLAMKCTDAVRKLEEFRNLDRQGMVYFIEGSGNEEKGKWVKLKSKALQVGGYLHNNLFEPFPTVAQTSATLAVMGGGNSKSHFNYLRREMGINKMERVDELVVASPFDWPNKALLVIPSDMPAYKFGDSSWDQAVCDHFERIIRAVRGRTLGLFTSFRVLDLVKNHLRHSDLPYEILAQREATNRQLQEQFKEDTGSVLLGSQSFAEGFDVQGEACTCVVLDKIPFITQDDPVLQGLSKHEDNIFMSYQLPEAIISFKQRIGRLIRTVNDVGVIVVLDNRLLTKRYRHQFMDSIPPLCREENIDGIEPFLRKVGAL